MSHDTEDPFKKIWGFHIHQELPCESFSKALVIQRNCSAYLRSHGVEIGEGDAFKPGYGPHVNYMWELRVENRLDDALEVLGLALSFLALNRFGLTAFIHPLMHDRYLPEDLATEGQLNQKNILWFGDPVDQNQDFFQNPPRDREGQLIDTRLPQMLSEAEKSRLLKEGEELLGESKFKMPEQHLVTGFDMHVEESLGHTPLARSVSEEYRRFMLGYRAKAPCAQIGIATGWLMCNRQGLPIFLQPVISNPKGTSEEHRAHLQGLTSS